MSAPLKVEPCCKSINITFESKDATLALMNQISWELALALEGSEDDDPSGKFYEISTRC